MIQRRKFLTVAITGFVALVVVGGIAVADELMGTIIKVDASAKKVTVLEKGTDKEIEVTITDDTEYVTGKGASKIDLEKVEKQLTKIKDAGKKGINVTVTHEKGVASKITPAAKKKAAN
jgi:biopolymer transport protein ExbD